ncbi:MAG: WXG100 family type VII secretion target [Lacisediminihabitans sp.]
MTDRELIDFGRMDDLADIIDTANRTIERALSSLDVEVSGLKNQWSGEASRAYTLAHDQWTGQIGALNQVLAQIHSATATITERHRSAERDAGSLWS